MRSPPPHTSPRLSKRPLPRPQPRPPPRRLLFKCVFNRAVPLSRALNCISCRVLHRVLLDSRRPPSHPSPRPAARPAPRPAPRPASRPSPRPNASSTAFIAAAFHRVLHRFPHRAFRRVLVGSSSSRTRTGVRGLSGGLGRGRREVREGGGVKRGGYRRLWGLRWK